MKQKPDPAWATIKQMDDPREFLQAVMNNGEIDMVMRIEAATALLSCGQDSNE
ncbi:hypothetical protein [Burkholderia sp. LMG 21824]|uniref:hypothetical protein n=1 Tax=Burkholderia sp. LMG 21824 TaxID=3158172 RepID=UPI003C2FDF4A